jgi:SAM-dependent methyltransferase
VILSNQVLEHMYYPEEVLASISRLQKEGDKLVLAVPNADGEHINHTVFYLLHLHVFTKESLEALLNRFGYEVIEDASPNPANIILAAEKKSGLLAKKFAYREGYMYRANKRLIQGLGFEGMSEGENYCIVWKQELDGSDAVKVRYLRAFESMLWPLYQVMWFIRSRVLKRISGDITMLVTPRHEQDRENVQIYFEDVVEVLIK